MSDESSGEREAPLARRTNELRLLHRISCEINASLEVERVLEVAMRSMDELFGLQHASVFLVDGESGELVLTARRGEGARDRQQRMRVGGQGLVGTAAAKREIVRLNFAREGAAGADAVECHLAIPMLAEDVLVGVLSAGTIADKILRKSDETLVTIIANQTAVAVQSARLYERLQRLNAELEERVRARTLELEAANRELREAQAELVHTGKMAALGQLAAGLAHEMNTPLAVIRSSSDVAGRAIGLIRGSLNPPAEAPSGRLERAFAAVEDSHRVTDEACQRVFTIFAALRSFAKLDEAELQPMDVHAGLDSAVKLLPHLLGDRIAIVREYGALPAVTCYAGEVNQVLLIVLTNAAEAIRGSGTITLYTSAEPGWVQIEIRDDGPGIAPGHVERIFDPGFTTKGVGFGAGLGLAIAFRIMHKHGGTIAVDSAPEKGTRVILRLPLTPS